MASVDMKGTVVIGEGEKDEAPMLYFGEQIGNGLEPEVDVAVDPIEGTSLTASGLPGAISVVALAERGSMFTTHVHYMQKLVVGRRARGRIDPRMTSRQNLSRIADSDVLRESPPGPLPTHLEVDPPASAAPHHHRLPSIKPH